jgi:hypothetical protein
MVIPRKIILAFSDFLSRELRYKFAILLANNLHDVSDCSFVLCK